MAWLRSALLLLAVVAASGVDAQPLRKVSRNYVLILTDSSGLTNKQKNIDFLQAALSSAGQYFDVVVVGKKQRPNFATLLWNADGTGRYKGIIMYPHLEGNNALTPAEIGILWDYQAKAAVRTVMYGCTPGPLGFAKAPAGATKKKIYWSDDAPALLGSPGVKAGAAVTGAGKNAVSITPGLAGRPLGTCNLYYKPKKLTIVSPCTSTPILMVATTPAARVVGMKIRHSDGREVVGFTQQCATRVGSACSETAKFSVNWMLQEAAATNDTNQQSPSPNPNPSPSPLPDGGNNATSTGTPICSPECVHGVCSAPGVCNCSSTPYIGATCETPTCTPSCAHGGKCVGVDTCNCTGTGYVGPTCEETPVCTPACAHAGRCIDTNTCDCQGTGYSGLTCSELCNPLCEHGGVCIATDTCNCTGTGYVGTTCQTPAVCSQPCAHGGRCSDPDTCDCRGTNYTGPTCQTPVCSTPCAHNGTCSAPDVCDCTGTGYEGPTCQTPVCSPACVHGVCSAPGVCNCSSGYTGATCTTSTCNPACLHGGDCTAPDTCNCAGTNYTGPTCETPICSVPCANSGTCSSPDVCNCTGTGYGGPTCQTPVCSPACVHGVCSAPGICNCSSGYTGATCATPTCNPACLHGGNCTAPDTCNCAGTNYTGPTCETPICSTPCAHNGTCSAPDVCNCTGTGYAGPTCQTPICSPACVNGVCSAPGVCNCSLGYIGATCETRTCVPACLNGGNCTGAGICNCTGTNFAGSACETPVCNPGCQNNGKCVAPNTCNCTSTGFTGPTCTTVARPATLYLDHKILLLTTPGFTNIDFLEAVFKGYGTPYDIIRWDVGNSPDLKALLWASDGSARYSSIFMHPNLEALSLMNKTEIDNLWQFQIRAGVRTVKVGAGNPELGYDYSGTCGGGAEALTFTADAPVGISGVNLADAQLEFNGIWRCPGKPIANSGCPLQNVLGANPANLTTSATVTTNCTVTPIIKNAAGFYTATLVKYQDGRESMGFMHECAAWSPTCLLLGHMALSWVTQGFIPGERAHLLTVQTDDVFLSTDQDDTGTQYRVSPYDLQRHLQWLSDLKSGAVAGLKLPANSDLKVDLPFNGNGILENSTGLTEISVNGESCTTFPDYVALGCNCWATGYQACPTTAPVFCQHCTKDWPKPLGTGTDNVKSLPSTSLWTPANLNLDPLAAAVIADTGGIATGFTWCHHTFTHENLDNATKYDATQQIALNIQMASALSLSTKTAVFSHSCMVTPEISGLMNGDVLAALSSNGITCSTGDNTWKHLLNPSNPHQMLYTTLASSNFAGYAILPRWATEIYYNCSTQAQNLQLYNNIYTQLGVSTFDQVLSREADRVLFSILTLRKDPHMMHQANLRVEGGSATDFKVGSSLLMKWVEAVLKRATSWVTWPVRSMKLDDLMDAFKAREARDACQPSYRLEVDSATGAVQAVTVKSNGGACKAPLMTGPSVSVASLSGLTKDGTDVTAPIYRVDLAAGASKRVVLSNSPAWVLPPLV